ncbi:MAG: TRAP transporter substrate-binding protein, partial [Cyclobacteriaceae bacterium]|nr:TRAP transporter substrate-binding protein [Cyclobacteriaceae bacterium]
SVPDVLIISQHIWNDLTEEEKGWLQQAADDSVPVERKLWAESVKESLEEVEKAGVIIYRPDKAPYLEKVKDVYESYQDQETIYSYIKRIQAVE